MDPLSITASIITVLDLTAKVISFLNGIKNASKERAKCAIEASNVFNLLTNLRYRLEEATPGDPWFTAVRALGTENGPLDQFKGTLEELISKLTPGAGFKKIGRAIVWNLDKAEVNDIISRIERLKSLIQIALEMDHSKLSQAIKGDVSELVEGFKRLEHREADLELRTIADWLTPIDFAKQQNDFIGRRQEGTGRWFLDSPEFTTWLNGVKQTLFCPGIPGAGKTTMASIVIDHLWRKFNDEETGIAFLYCNYKRQEEQKAVDLLAALLKQLVQCQQTTPQPLKTLYDCHVQRRSRPSFEEIAEVLRSVVSGYSRVYVIVDALDECLDKLGNRSAILAELRILQAEADVRLLATSRFNSNILQEFKGETFLEIRASNADVERYVESHISRLSLCVQDNHTLQQTIKEDITRAVDGMFLLAQLHFDSLMDKKTVKAIKTALVRLPKGLEALDEAYGDAVERIDSQSRGDRDLAHNVLSWLVNAVRPLTTTELQHALAIELGEHALDEDNLPVAEEMLSVCQGLVTVDEESNIIRMVHYTTQVYFESLQMDWMANAPANIASMCITYLSYNVFASGRCRGGEEYESRMAQNKFLAYAADHWADHAHGIEEKVRYVAMKLLQSEALVSSVSQAMSGPEDFHLPYFKYCAQTKLHLVAAVGLQVLTKCLLDDGAFSDPVNEYDYTPLHVAAVMGHDQIIELLLSHNADVNLISKDGTALHLAAQQGYEKIVEQLLDHNANVNLKDGDGKTPLQKAALQGHEEIVKRLLNHNANVNSKDYTLRTSLHGAANEGHEKIVKQLLDHNANVNSKDGDEATPLHKAALGGNDEIVKQLLDHNADVNSKDGDEETPLHKAARRGYEDIMKQLLDHKADGDLKNEYGCTPLLLAVMSERDGTVNILLNHKVNVNLQDEKGKTALLGAAEHGDEHIVNMLLNHNPDVNLKNHKGETALYVAAKEGYEKIVELLLNRNADATLVNNGGETALQAAKEYGHKGVARLLEAYTLARHSSDPASLPTTPQDQSR